MPSPDLAQLSLRATTVAHFLLEFDAPEDVVHPKCLGQNWTKEEGKPNGGDPNSSLWERERQVYSVTDCSYIVWYSDPLPLTFPSLLSIKII